MGQITADQSQQIMALLATNVDWSSIDFDELDFQKLIVRNSQRAGKQFELFLKNGCQFFVRNSWIVSTMSFDPAEFINRGWAFWMGPVDGDGLSGEEDMDPRSLTLSEIDLTKIIFETCLKEGEKSIEGEEKLRRLKKMSERILLGDKVFLALWKDYQGKGEDSLLERLYKDQGVVYLDFFGTILRSPSGRRMVLFLCRDGGGGWCWDYGWLGCDWGADIPSATLASTQT